MKGFLALSLFVGLAYGLPSNSEEYIDAQNNWSSSLENANADSVADGSFSFESLEIPLQGSGDWRQSALDYMNMLRARAGVPPYELDSGLNKMSQAWAEKNACSGLNHDKIDTKKFYAENLAGLNTASKTGSDKSKMATDGIQRWYDEVKDYDCREMQYGSGMTYYYKVGHYMNTMSKQYNVVGFGLAICPGKTEGQLVARFNGKDGYAQKKQAEEMEKQGLTYDTFSQLDRSQYIPCPSEFTAYP